MAGTNTRCLLYREFSYSEMTQKPNGSDQHQVSVLGERIDCNTRNTE